MTTTPGREIGAVATWSARRRGFVVHRPVRPCGSDTFPLAAVCTGLPSRLPLLVNAAWQAWFSSWGSRWPGLASVVSYAPLRSAATRRGMAVLMVDHRGVSLCRRDTCGATCRWAPLEDLSQVAAGELTYTTARATPAASRTAAKSPAAASTVIGPADDLLGEENDRPGGDAGTAHGPETRKCSRIVVVVLGRGR